MRAYINEVVRANGHLFNHTITFFPANGLNPYTGYGRVELGIVRELQGLGLNVENWPAGIAPTVVVGSAEWLDAPHLKGDLFLYTMSESDQVSETWVDAMNRRAKAVFVPCSGLVDVYHKSGVDVPVHDVGLGMDLFTEGLVATPIKQYADDPFTFMTYSLGDARKGAELAIMAFLQCFAGDDRYRLIVKARDGWNTTWLAGLDDPQIEVVGNVQSNGDWEKLLTSVDCFVFPSKGEGYGLPPREATLGGVPTIATEWLGMADVANWGIPLRVDYMQKCTFDHYGANAQGAQWAYPDVAHLKQRMVWVSEHYNQALEVARQGREWLWMNCRWSQVVKRMVEVMYGSNG